MFDISLDMSEFRRQARGTKNVLARELQKATQLACEHGVEVAKRDGKFQNRTGLLRSSIMFDRFRRLTQGGAGEFTAACDYGAYVEYGTSAHQIWPKAPYRFKGPLREGQTRRATGKGPHEHIVGRGIALRWKDAAGKESFARMVNHKGSKPYPFMSLGAAAAELELTRLAHTAIAIVGRLWT